ncbi:hypothetical protein BGZ65_004390 [Modicella reniformis]|uniref:Velvet domain-containing protein n=1 Tax=Modicella reniformis TaxID=1440133 RepID=A0A9P6M8Y5_9FUNG|nr:hypothetical protein BGZ65_004390 [Modicella reniformis]
MKPCALTRSFLSDWPDPFSQLSDQTFIVTADLWLEDEMTECDLVLISPIPSSKTVDSQQQHKHQQASIILESQQATTPGLSSASIASRMSIHKVIHDQEEHQDGDELEAGADADGEEEEAGADGEEEDEAELHPDEGQSVEQETGRSTRNLVGQISVNGQAAPDLNNGMLHIWFAFSILSIRTEGFFKLRFCLTDIERIPRNKGGKSKTICEVFSNTIHVQTPKRFQGTYDNNEIAVHLNKNSIRIPARKDENKRRSPT